MIRAKMFIYMILISAFLFSAVTETAAEEDAVDVLSPETLANLPDILNKLEGEYMTTWQTARDSNNFIKIAGFADQIQLFGEEWGLTVLSRYGRTLKDYCDTFDVENIGKKLEEYPGIVGSL